jgi:hypothetical protein
MFTHGGNHAVKSARACLAHTYARPTDLFSTTLEHPHYGVEQLSLTSKTRELSGFLFFPKRPSVLSATPTAIGSAMSSNQNVRTGDKPRRAMPLVTKVSQGGKDPKPRTVSSASAVPGSSSAPPPPAAEPIPRYIQPTKAFRNMAKVEIVAPAASRVRDRVQAVKKAPRPGAGLASQTTAAKIKSDAWKKTEVATKTTVSTPTLILSKRVASSAMPAPTFSNGASPRRHGRWVAVTSPTTNSTHPEPVIQPKEAAASKEMFVPKEATLFQEIAELKEAVKDLYTVKRRSEQPKSDVDNDSGADRAIKAPLAPMNPNDWFKVAAPLQESKPVNIAAVAHEKAIAKTTMTMARPEQNIRNAHGNENKTKEAEEKQTIEVAIAVNPKTAPDVSKIQSPANKPVLMSELSAQTDISEEPVQAVATMDATNMDAVDQGTPKTHTGVITTQSPPSAAIAGLISPVVPAPSVESDVTASTTLLETKSPEPVSSPPSIESPATVSATVIESVACVADEVAPTLALETKSYAAHRSDVSGRYAAIDLTALAQDEELVLAYISKSVRRCRSANTRLTSYAMSKWLILRSLSTSPMAYALSS